MTAGRGTGMDSNSLKAMWLAVSVLLAVSLLARTALAQRQRNALVIGNGDYQGANLLANPVNDAELMQRVLQRLGFNVSLEINLNREQMEAAIGAFRSRLKLAGSDGVGLFYYAGHGIQSRGNNYLIPLAADTLTESGLAQQAINAQKILGRLQGTGAAFTMMILDTCRNNPLQDNVRPDVRPAAKSVRNLALEIASGGGQLGFASMGTHERVLIAYSAAPSQPAKDAAQPGDRNSPYAAALARHMMINRPEPLDLARVLARTADAVHRATGGAQLPWIEGSPRGTPFYFQQPRDPGFYLTVGVTAGQRITRSNVETVRVREIPDAGGHIRHFGEIRGGCYARDKEEGAQLVWEDITASCFAR